MAILRLVSTPTGSACRRGVGKALPVLVERFGHNERAPAALLRGEMAGCDLVIEEAARTEPSSREIGDCKCARPLFFLQCDCSRLVRHRFSVCANVRDGRRVGISAASILWEEQPKNRVPI